MCPPNGGRGNGSSTDSEVFGSNSVSAAGTGSVFVEHLQAGTTTQVTNADLAANNELNFAAGNSGDGYERSTLKDQMQ